METKIMVDKYGRRRGFCKVKCDACGKDFWKAKRFLKSKKQFCSPMCRAEGSCNKIKVKCSCCGKEFGKRPSSLINSKSGLYFCSRECKDKAQTLDVGILKIEHYKDGEWAYSRRARVEYGEKCAHCGYHEHTEGLEVHHIDGNRKNNKLSNLIVLCALCHRLVTNKVFKVIDRKLVGI
jgi:hypothetical protein